MPSGRAKRAAFARHAGALDLSPREAYPQLSPLVGEIHRVLIPLTETCALCGVVGSAWPKPQGNVLWRYTLNPFQTTLRHSLLPISHNDWVASW